MQEKEQDIQRAMTDYLRLKKYVVFKHHSTGFSTKNGQTVHFKYGDRGISDLIACAPDGKFWAIEVKKKGGKPSPEQIEFIERVRANGGVAFIAYSLDEVIEAVANPASCMG